MPEPETEKPNASPTVEESVRRDEIENGEAEDRAHHQAVEIAADAAATERAAPKTTPAAAETGTQEPQGEPEQLEHAEPPVPQAAVDTAPAPLVNAEPEREPARPRIQLSAKHPLAIRWMHWINFPVLFMMIWSGLLVYWNDSDNAYRHAHAVYRVGIGSWTLVRFFPEWFYKALDVPYHVTQGLAYHFFFMWLFAINGIAYVLFLAVSGEWRFLVPTRKSLLEAIQVTLVDLHLRKGLPAQTKYNGAQRIAYTSCLVMGAGSLLTGLAIYKPTQLHWITTVLGGYEMARWEHFWLTAAFCAFFVVHVTQVVLAGWNNFRSMVSGLEIKRAEERTLQEERESWS